MAPPDQTDGRSTTRVSPTEMVLGHGGRSPIAHSESAMVFKGMVVLNLVRARLTELLVWGDLNEGKGISSNN